MRFELLCFCLSLLLSFNSLLYLSLSLHDSSWNVNGNGRKRSRCASFLSRNMNYVNDKSAKSLLSGFNTESSRGKFLFSNNKVGNRRGIFGDSFLGTRRIAAGHHLLKSKTMLLTSQFLSTTDHDENENSSNQERRVPFRRSLQF